MICNGEEFPGTLGGHAAALRQYWAARPDRAMDLRGVRQWIAENPQLRDIKGGAPDLAARLLQRGRKKGWWQVRRGAGGVTWELSGRTAGLSAADKKVPAMREIVGRLQLHNDAMEQLTAMLDAQEAQAVAAAAGWWLKVSSGRDPDLPWFASFRHHGTLGEPEYIGTAPTMAEAILAAAAELRRALEDEEGKP